MLPRCQRYGGQVLPVLSRMHASLPISSPAQTSPVAEPRWVVVVVVVTISIASATTTASIFFIDSINYHPNVPRSHYYTTLLIPLEHSTVIPPSTPLSPPPPLAIAKAPAFIYNPAPSFHKSSSHIYVPIIASVGGALLLGLGLLGAICFSRKRRSKPETIKPDTWDAEDFEIESSILSNMSELLASDRLIRFSFKELQEATDNFSEAHRIKNSIFHAILRRNKVKIKQMRGQVSKEINALHKFHHTSLVTLLGICVEESSD